MTSRLCLEELYKTMRKKSQLQVTVPEGFEDYTQDTDTYHEAGFDAFVTGCAFAYMKEEYGEGVIDENINLVRMNGKNMFYFDLSKDLDKNVYEVKY